MSKTSLEWTHRNCVGATAAAPARITGSAAVRVACFRISLKWALHSVMQKVVFLYISYLVECGLQHITLRYPPFLPMEAPHAPQLHCSPGRPSAGAARCRSLASAHPRIPADQESLRAVLDLGRSQPAPINWVLGALGIHLGLGFADTVIVLVLGNLIGMLLFGCFVLLGQKTGATGMVLARAAFGRRGNYLPAAIQALLVIGWCAVNTWIILDLVMALFGTLGWVDPTPRTTPGRSASPRPSWPPGGHRLVRLQGHRCI